MGCRLASRLWQVALVPLLCQAQQPGASCPPGYSECENCCDVDAECTCDQWCPEHPEVWATPGCSVPKSVEDAGETEEIADFVCPSGYTQCATCCDLDADCACDGSCSDAFPAEVACSLAPGEDRYSSGSSPCPQGYTMCGTSCDLDDDCKLDSCGAPHGFPCTVPARVQADGSALLGGEVRVFAGPLSFDLAELSCLEKGGHLLSLHSSNDWHRLTEAVLVARIETGVFVGGYRDSQGDWAWTDNTAVDRPELTASMAPDGMQGVDDELAYCNVDCVENYLKPQRVNMGTCTSFDSCCEAGGCEGLVSLGRRDDTTTELAYACRLTTAGNAIQTTAHGRRVRNECQAQFGCESGVDVSGYTCVAASCMEVDWDGDGSQHDDDCCGVPEDAYPTHGVYTYCSAGYTMLTGSTCDGNGGFDGGGSKYTSCCVEDAVVDAGGAEQQSCDDAAFYQKISDMTQACCNDQGVGNCDSGLPESCPGLCAAVVIPFAQECKRQLQAVPDLAATINAAVENCRVQSANVGDQGGTDDDASKDDLYIAVNQRVDRSDALDYCREHYHDLASIHCTHQNDLVTQACATINHSPNPQSGEITTSHCDLTSSLLLNWPRQT